MLRTHGSLGPTGHPEPTTTSWRLFFGEVGWSPGFSGPDFGVGQRRPERRCRLAAAHRVPFGQRTIDYSFEAGEYDCSLSEPVTLYRPEWQTAESMRLKWAGLGADFKNAAGELVAMDPSTDGSGSPALIIRESDFADYLESAGLALIWTVLGERDAYNPKTHGPVGRFAPVLRCPTSTHHQAPQGSLDNTAHAPSRQPSQRPRMNVLHPRPAQRCIGQGPMLRQFTIESGYSRAGV